MAGPQHRHDGQYIGAERYEADERRRDLRDKQIADDLGEIKERVGSSATAESVADIRDQIRFVTRSLFTLILGFVVVGGLTAYFTLVKGGV